MFRSFKLSVYWLIYVYLCFGCTPTPQNINVTVKAVDENQTPVARVRVYIDNRYMGETDSKGSFSKRLEEKEIKPISYRFQLPEDYGLVEGGPALNGTYNVEEKEVDHDLSFSFVLMLRSVVLTLDNET